MPRTELNRAPFNDLAYILGALDPSSLESAVQAFPEFSDEVKRGPDAGTTGEDREYALRRAAFTQELSNKIINAIEPHAGLVLARAASINRWKLLVIILGALGGNCYLNFSRNWER